MAVETREYVEARDLTKAERRQQMRDKRQAWRKANEIQFPEIPESWERFHFVIAYVTNKGRLPDDPAHETLAINWLTEHGLAAWSPVGTRNSRKRCGKQRSRHGRTEFYYAFPGYVLIGTGPGYAPIDRAYQCDRYIGGLLGHNGVPTRVNFLELSRIIAMQRANGFEDYAGRPLQKGDLVEILDDPFNPEPEPVRVINARKSSKGSVYVASSFFNGAAVQKIPVDSLRRVGS